MCEDFPGDLVAKNLPANPGDVGSLPGPGISPGEGNGCPLHYTCLGNPLDRGAWQPPVHGDSKESDMTWQLNNKRDAYFLYFNIPDIKVSLAVSVYT